ncbi:alginate export family protein [Aequorivita xiaoshiensis]|uniref:Alginate export family protein n=1 Tax=Aequorivita xiaoshiensis TaxID=2874476 RepID=A0A9X1UC73_9FLAO|nr:alginate export family protein [Aequorivita xiaoshiensis]MCG2430321.1 alginate export family protein [Aequorivita xiaoshiensis]
MRGILRQSSKYSYRKTFVIMYFVVGFFSFHGLLAQGIGNTDPYEDKRIEKVTIEITNPSQDIALNERLIDKVRQNLKIFPDKRFLNTQVDFALSQSRQDSRISETKLDLAFGPTGGVLVTIYLTLGDGIGKSVVNGFFKSGKISELPKLYNKGNTFIRLKLEALAIHYSNTNAWYAQPDALLNGNPLVEGTPAGNGYDDWVEGFAHLGIYGITPITDNFLIYGGVSAIVSGSKGEELFTNKTRGYLGIEDAYIGFVTGKTWENGHRLAANISVGRQRYTIGNGFLIANTSSNGGSKAALQSNPRWSADLLARASIKYDNTSLEFFYLDPDELPIVDSKTKILGLNVEALPTASISVGGSVLAVQKSEYGYFTTKKTYSREGLRVFDARFRWQPKLKGQSGIFIAGEAGLQTNVNFPMRAHGYFGEVGYNFSKFPWKPTISYRYASFTGDDGNTDRFERWDPLYSGGNGEQWVQGINHFKVVQNSNAIMHRLQIRLRPRSKLELVPQIWFFKADSKTNLGGNPALSFIESKDYGFETNLTFKVFLSRKIFIQGHVAATFPGDAVATALSPEIPKNWWSTMLFMRYAL